MQEDEDFELRDKGRTWDGELSESDSEENGHRRRNQGVISREAAFARLVPSHPSFFGQRQVLMLVFEGYSKGIARWISTELFVE